MDTTSLRIGIVAAEWNDFIVSKLITGATEALAEHGVPAANVTQVRCPGSFEIPVVASAMAGSGRYDAVIALGVVIRGETAHFEYVSGPVAYGLANIAVATGVPCIFGVLTTENIEQALDRAGGNFGNKGAESATAAIKTIAALHEVRR
ncbi:MAG: 6,7-dimethyl-8-ribityllumazine synthase [Candidatus Kapabacteria bacterium]|nr:6,7-dimethyl-8-ribityllumazine synthase [Candidatus Kapabacteria bacterium]